MLVCSQIRTREIFVSGGGVLRLAGVSMLLVCCLNKMCGDRGARTINDSVEDNQFCSACADNTDDYERTKSEP